MILPNPKMELALLAQRRLCSAQILLPLKLLRITLIKFSDDIFDTLPDVSLVGSLKLKCAASECRI